MRVFVLLMALLAAGAAVPKEGTLRLAERYPGPWRLDFYGGITQTLISNGVRGCGEYKWRESSHDRGEYLVYCSRDGKRWLVYLIWPNTGKVNGPHEADTSLR